MLKLAKITGTQPNSFYNVFLLVYVHYFNWDIPFKSYIFNMIPSIPKIFIIIKYSFFLHAIPSRFNEVLEFKELPSLNTRSAFDRE